MARSGAPAVPISIAAPAALRIREEVRRAGGREVCFLAELDDERRVVNPRPVARGNHHAVLAAARDARPGEILLHNHPSGVLEPSEADLALAARVYEEGLGTGIVDNEASGLYVVVEPPAARERKLLDPAEAERILGPAGPLAGRHPAFEDRPSQRRMARRVAERYNEGGVLVVEAGTGTGKSLAYLVPAALWALSNGERTVVSTNTINLQEQLVGKDLPLVQRLLGQELRWSLVKGRGNYVSIRRLLLAAGSAPSLFETDRSEELAALVEWSRTTQDGSLSDLATSPSPEVWDEVRSDGDICLKARCPHFQNCFYQRARRAASSADLLVVNHALLFSDVALREATDNWAHAAVLPPYRHVILDEGHNVEDAATSHLGSEVTRLGLFRALARLERGGKGVLASIEAALAGRADAARGRGPDEADLLRRIQDVLRPAHARARESLAGFFDALEPTVPTADEEPLRLGRGDPRDPGENRVVLHRLEGLDAAFGRLEREIEELRQRLEGDEVLRAELEGRILDLRAVERRLEAARRGLQLVLAPKETQDRFVRWIEGRTGEGGAPGNVRLAAAPVEPGRQLRRGLFEKVESVVITSATLTVGKDGFAFLRRRLGLDEGVREEGGAARSAGMREDGGAPRASGVREEGGPARSAGPGEPAALPPAPSPALAFEDALPVFDVGGGEAEELRLVQEALASPFDYARQTVLAVPTDLPGVAAGHAFQDATASVVREVAAMTEGGVFALFTSHRALRSVARRLREAEAASRWPLLVHGEAPRHLLLSRFVGSGRAILLGTSSFWEGVDVPGDPLRALIIQKLPFRVPSEPITQARMEAMEERGENPFRSYLLPLAALRLKQGFGRLVRSREDRGAVLLLDDRLLSRGYGRVLRGALPPAPLLRGPWEELRVRLRGFYEEREDEV